jgi:ubiquinone/menaquinone biosynthesis C-methylase UbiE
MTVSTHKIWHMQDEAERRKWQNPEAILKETGLKPGMTLIDMGCGNGFFTLPAARLAGEKGQVYGLDINSDFIEQTAEKAAEEGLRNLNLTTGAAEEMLLCEGCADVVFLGIVLHDFRDPARVLKNARKMLKTDGKLANLDWKKKATGFGPPVSIRFNEETASKMIEEAGFKVEKVKDSGPDHYLIIARPA